MWTRRIKKVREHSIGERVGGNESGRRRPRKVEDHVMCHEARGRKVTGKRQLSIKNFCLKVSVYDLIPQQSSKLQMNFKRKTTLFSC